MNETIIYYVNETIIYIDTFLRYYLATGEPPLNMITPVDFSYMKITDRFLVMKSL